MNDLSAVERTSEWQRLKALVLDSVSSPITRRVYGLTGILYQFVREYSEGFERDGGVGQGPAFEALAPHQH